MKGHINSTLKQCKCLSKHERKHLLIPTHLINQNISFRNFSFNNQFSRSREANYELWSSLISNLAQTSTNAEFTLRQASQLLETGIRPDGYALSHFVRVSTDLGYEFYCQQLHAYILRSGFVSNVFVSNALMKFYKKNDLLEDARKVFVEIPQPSVISWNSLISGYVQKGRFCRGLELFIELDRAEVCANAFSFTAALAACGQLRLLQLGRLIHSKIVKYGLEWGIVVENCLIDMYGKCGSVGEATWVFKEMVDKDNISWNSVIASCARNGELGQACLFFHEMANPDTITYNELISGFSQFGNIDDAIKILSSMPNPNSSSWNSILTGFVNKDRAREGLNFFSKMQFNAVEKDGFTYSIILSGVAGLSAVTWGMLIHSCVIKCALDVSVVVASALIDMYSKCGQINDAESIFESIPDKNLITWNAMISGYGHNGHSTRVIELFEKLKTVRHLKPDSVTFLNVLAACTHNEMSMEKVIMYFESMINEYEIKPSIEHCCSMIRVMGLKGEVWRAERMIYGLGFGSCSIVWRALLGACGSCRDLKVAKSATAKLIELEGGDDYVYVMISNIYASYGKWREVSSIRNVMRKKGVMKEVGCSWIQV